MYLYYDYQIGQFVVSSRLAPDAHVLVTEAVKADAWWFEPPIDLLGMVGSAHPVALNMRAILRAGFGGNGLPLMIISLCGDGVSILIQQP